MPKMSGCIQKYMRKLITCTVIHTMHASPMPVAKVHVQRSAGKGFCCCGHAQVGRKSKP